MKIFITLIGSGVLIASNQFVYSGQQHKQVTVSKHQTQESQGPGMDSSCCLPDGSCVDKMDWATCENKGGTYYDYFCGDYICVPACEDAGVFASVAHALEFTCGALPWNLGHGGGSSDFESKYIDLDGNGSAEQIISEVSVTVDAMDDTSVPSTMFKQGDVPGTFGVYILLDAHPDTLLYEGLTIGDEFDVREIGYFDVTGDGLVDAILRVHTNQTQEFYYVENISVPPGKACATDINDDGSTNVNDLLEVVGNWGPCE